MIQSKSLFDEFLAKAESNPEFGFSSYVLRKGQKYKIHHRENGQYGYDASLEKATRFREYEAQQQSQEDRAVIEIIDDPHTRASNAFWRVQATYRVDQIRMEGKDKENPENNQFWGITPAGKKIKLYTSISDEGMTEVYWCATQEVPWRLFAYTKDFSC